MTEVYAEPANAVRLPQGGTGSKGATVASESCNLQQEYPLPQATANTRAYPAGPVLSVRNVRKLYGNRDSLTTALAGITFDVEPGEFVGIMGPSGSGKTTLLNCIAAIDRITTGRIAVAGCDITEASRRQLAKFRRDQLGFIFQDANLIDTLTGFENIALALTIKGEPSRGIPATVDTLAKRLGVSDVLQKYPHQMSGGQRQRVAAARAMAGDPALVLADEPTGALDSRAASVLLETLEALNTQLNATILMVTHDAFAASFTGRVLFVKDGRLFTELRRGADTRQAFFARIMDVVSFLGGEANTEASRQASDDTPASPASPLSAASPTASTSPTAAGESGADHAV